MHIKCFILLLLVLTNLLILSVSEELPDSKAKHQQTPNFIYHAGYTHNPPFINRREKQAPNGLMADIFFAALKHNDIKYETRYYPVKRYYRTVLQGTTHLHVMPKGLPAFNEVLSCGETKIAEVDLGIYWQGESTVNDFKDIIERRLIVISGYHYLSLSLRDRNILKATRKVTAPSNTSALLMLVADRGDYLITYDKLLNTSSKKLDTQKLKHFSINKQAYYFCVNRAMPDAKEILMRVDNTLQQFTDDGTIDVITRKYVN